MIADHSAEESDVKFTDTRFEKLGSHKMDSDLAQVKVSCLELRRESGEAPHSTSLRVTLLSSVSGNNSSPLFGPMMPPWHDIKSSECTSFIAGVKLISKSETRPREEMREERDDPLKGQVRDRLPLAEVWLLGRPWP